MRIISVLLLLTVICGSCAYAIGLEAGCFSTDSVNSLVLSLQQDYSSGNYSLGYTLNANMSDINYGLESVVVKYLEYDDGTVGVRYAPLEGMSFGYGLLLNDLNTVYYHPSFMTNDQSALRVYCDLNEFVVEGFGTFGHLYGVRLKDFSFLNMNFGLSYIGDANMISRESYGRSAYGAYAELPLTDEFSLFGETAGSSNGGEGNMAGVSFDYDLIIAYSKARIAAVSFNDKFIPGYFTTGYDLDPIDLASLEAPGLRRFGSMSSLSLGILGIISIDYNNENYSDGGIANSGSLFITPAERFSITGYVKELSFRDLRVIKGIDSNMIGGQVGYKTKSGISASLNYEKSITKEIFKPFETYFFRLGYNF